MTATGILTAVAHTKRLRQGVALVAMCAMLGSCAGGIAYNDFDEAGGISKKEYEDLLGRKAPAPQVSNANEPPIPSFQSVVAAPSAPELADTRRVSIAVTESTPVRDILIELARKAGVDLQMDPRITGGIIMTATDRPFIEVIDRIVELAELRYRFDKNTLHVEVDDPYLEQYRMDVLNISRQARSSASSSTDAASSAQAVGASGGGGDNKSATAVTSATNSDFWNRIGGNIEQILAGTRPKRDTSRPAPITAAFVPEAAAPAGAAPAGAVPTGTGTAAPTGAGAAAASAAAPAGAGQAAAPATPALVAGQSGASAGTVLASAEYSLNPEAGIITIFGSQRQQRAVERYLREVRASVTQQILIEAKVLEVTLNDQYRAGVNWNAVFGPNNGLQDLVIGTNFTREVVPPEFSDATFTASWTNGADLDLAVQMVKQFGTVRTLSSPRLTALNNQVAQLKVAKNQVFFELDVTFTEGTTGGQRDKIQVESQIKTVPVGMIMSVQPAVDPITRRISLNLRPSITRITGFVNDPGVAVAVSLAQNVNPNLPLVTSPVPIIEVREMDSVLNLESGQTVVMGGLMQETAQTTREGFPGLMDVPLLGQAASQNIKQNQVTELVIFIRATLANGAGTIADEDIRLYKAFSPDPRPIVF